MDIKAEAKDTRESIIKLYSRFHHRSEITAGELYDEMLNLILQSYERVCREQRNRDRAVYSINRTKTSQEIKDAILKAPLITDK